MNQTNGDVSPLQINVVANLISKALVTGSNFTGSAKIGVKLVDDGGTTYDNQTYNNIYYSTSDGTSWMIDPAKSILLSATPGTAYAYYPFTDNASLDFTAIPISSAANPNDQVDYMYGNVASGLKNSNPTASFTMNHAMSIVNFEIARGNYTGTGAITSVTMKGNTASNTGTMNAVAGTVTATNAGYEFTSTTALSLGSATGKFIVVPSGTSSVLDFKVVMDGQTYTASTAPVELESGEVYKYTLKMSSTGMTVSTVTVTPWGSEQDMGSLDTDLYKTILTWEEAKEVDGVYGITSDNKAMVYEAANTTEEALAGVALVMNGKAIEIATGLASMGSKWAATAPMSDEEKAYFSTYYINEEAEAKADMNGKANTERILNAGVTIATLINNFNTTAGSTGWYLPSLGQLCNMWTYRSQVTALVKKISGSDRMTMSYPLSSTVYSDSEVWIISFSNGVISKVDVTAKMPVWLVRDL